MEELIIGLCLTVFGSVVGLIDKWKRKTEDGHKKSNSISAKATVSPSLARIAK